MAEARLTAKNTFGEGLIMDFAPDNTLANVLTNALNATLLTYNGNEMSLLNDMGNGRVETAFLPDGYIPMGTCEFGGIIYIVSYNPLENLCLIGSFPSPERNITKEDKLPEALMPPPLTNEYFLGNDGKLNSLVSKILISDNLLNPGDMYIVELSGAYGEGLKKCITDLDDDEGKSKNIKLSVVSIEDSGKINKLDTINYEITSTGTEYYIPESGESGGAIETVLGADLDTYRLQLLQNYNIFSSKIPGKLAILAELEVIDTFSCGHKVITETVGETTTYHVYIDYKWTASNNTINPKYITLTEFNWESTLEPSASGKEIYVNYYDPSKGTYVEVPINRMTSGTPSSTDTAINVLLPELVDKSTDTSKFFHELKDPTTPVDLSNYLYKNSKYLNSLRLLNFYKVDDNSNIITKSVGEIGEKTLNNDLNLSSTFHLCDIIIPNKFKDTVFRLPYKLQYSITPAMNFGLLEHLTVDNEIDFSLIGTKTIKTSGFKYFASQDVLTLNIDSDIYEEINHKVTNMALEFYDFNGFCGSYIFNNLESYSGNLIINIPLDSMFLNRNKFKGTKLWTHDSTKDIGTMAKETSFTIEQELDKSLDTGDCGILQSNLLYGVKLIYEYSSLDPITLEVDNSTPELIIKGFWMYTDGQFNDYYYTLDNFESIVPLLPVYYSYEMHNRVAKRNTKFNSKTASIVRDLLNSNDSLLNALKSGGDLLVTEVDYYGWIDNILKIGVKEDSIFGILPEFTETPRVEIGLRGINSEDTNFDLVQTTTENDLEESIPYDDFDKANSSFKPLKTTVELDKTLRGYAGLKMDIKNILFKVEPTDYKLTNAKTTILTPILYKTNQNDTMNYHDVGGQYVFLSSLCYTGSDNKESDLQSRDSDDCWFLTIINDLGAATADLTIYEYPSGRLHLNITDGHESLLLYYNGLGNRLPFTLFNVLIALPDPDRESGYCVYWTHNIKAPGNVYTLKGKKGDYSDEVPNNKHRIYEQSNSDRSASCEWSPKPNDRSYIPAFITNRIANGGYEVAMSSSGGATYEHGDADLDYIPYTSKTGGELKNWYPKYLHALEQMFTVSPDIHLRLVGTFTYNEDSCKDVQLTALLTAKLLNKQAFQGTSFIKLRNLDFNLYITNVINSSKSIVANGSGGDTEEVAYLSTNDNNVSVSVNTELLGEKDPAIVTVINFNFPHEHSLLDSYLDYGSYPLACYLNGYYDIDAGRYVSSYSPNLIRVNEEINSSKFYILVKEKEEFKLVCLDNSHFTTNSSGDIYPIVSLETLAEVIKNALATSVNSFSSTAYVASGNPIFPETNMSIDDFEWDPDNKKHHFYFIGENKLKLVNARFAYLLDDDYGDEGSYKTARLYYIGPSFTVNSNEI